MKARTYVFVFGGIALAFLLFVLSVSQRTIPQPIFEIKGETLWEVTIIPGVADWLGTLEIRNTLLTSWCIVAFLVVVAYFSGRTLKWIPSGWQNVVEGVIDGIQGLIVNTAGETHARRFFWVIATFLIYIAVSNWLALLPIFNVVGKIQEVTPHHFHDEAVVISDTAGLSVIGMKTELIELEVDDEACNAFEGEEQDALRGRSQRGRHRTREGGERRGRRREARCIIPYFRSVNTDLMTPLSLRDCLAIFIEYWGISTLGFLAYSSKFFNSKSSGRAASWGRSISSSASSSSSQSLRG